MMLRMGSFKGEGGRRTTTSGRGEGKRGKGISKETKMPAVWDSGGGGGSERSVGGGWENYKDMLSFVGKWKATNSSKVS